MRRDDKNEDSGTQGICRGQKHNFLKKFYFIETVDLQCINFCCIYIYIHYHILFHYGLSQAVEYSSLCYTVGLCCLSILHVTVCIN